MGGNFQLIQQRFVVQTVGSKTVQIHHALRRQPNFIGETGEIILPLAVVLANGINRFPAVTKLFQGFADVLHRRLVAACEVFQIHHNTGDIAVVLRLANGVDDIKQ